MRGFYKRLQPGWAERYLALITNGKPILRWDYDGSCWVRIK